MVKPTALSHIPYYVYIVECADKTLYTGITTDIEKRLAAHNSKKTGAKYTRSRRPVVLKFFQKCKNKSEASRLEAQMKQMDRYKKIHLIKTWSM